MNASSADLVVKEYTLSASKLRDAWVAVRWKEARKGDGNIAELRGGMLGTNMPSVSSDGAAPSHTPNSDDDADTDDEEGQDSTLQPGTVDHPKSQAVKIHNKRLHRALERALELKVKVDDVHQEVMGDEADDY